MLTFDEAFDRLIGHEGGYSNSLADPGGETNWGISKRSYPMLQIRTLAREEAKAIYLRDFWQPLAGLPTAVRFQAFDFAVNSGISTSVRKLQAALGVADDGHWGPVSAAAAAAADPADLLMRFVAQRLRYMASLTTWATFGRGWANRIAGQLEFGAKDT